MDNTQLLPKKTNLPRLKSLRFSNATKRFSLTSLGCVLFYALFFGILSVWQMTLICSVAAILWGGLLLILYKGMEKLAFLAGVILSAIFSLLSSWLLGWESGFFLLTLLLIPFLLSQDLFRVSVRIILAAVFAAAVLGLFILSWSQASFWVLSGDFLHLLTTVNLIFAVIVSAIFGYTYRVAISDAEMALIHSNKKLASLSSTDPVTNLVNTRIILSRIEQEKNRMQRGNKPFCLIMMDVDDFKNIIDLYGYSCGDFVMSHLAELISLTLRKQDEVARWGGDEFLLLLPETDIEGGKIVAEKIRSKISKSPFFYKESEISVTVTLGVGLCEKDNGVGSCIHKADHALYLAKQAGKNRVSLFQDQ